MKMYRILIGCVLLGLSLVGCGGGTGTGGTYGSAETLTFEGWASYRGGNDDKKAEELFRNALSLDPTFAEAHNGLGWLNFRRAGQAKGDAQKQLLGSAKTSFQKATSSNPNNVDAWAGLAGLELAQGNWEQARDSANRALSLNSRFFSSRDNIDYRDLHLILAE
ncbi:MAG: tetratricopeptide repeat protein, partial [bacterium]|nr:tetratricopeptide repeat protein [bacterium]